MIEFQTGVACPKLFARQLTPFAVTHFSKEIQEKFIQRSFAMRSLSIVS